MRIFIDLGMIEVLEDETIYMNEVQKMIGSESAAAERVRRHRKSAESLAGTVTLVTGKRYNVTQNRLQCYGKRYNVTLM